MRRSKQESDHDSTFTDVTGLGHHEQKYQRWLQILSHWLLLVIPVIALFGFLDPRTETSVNQHANGELEIRYTEIARVGQSVPLHITLTSNETLDQPITLQLCGSYFDRLDFQNWYPNPASETRTGDHLVYEFDPPQATEFVVSLDARAAPESGVWPETCELTVETSNVEISTTFTTWRMP